MSLLRILSALAQVCASFPQALLPTVEKLYILESRPAELSWQVDLEKSHMVGTFGFICRRERVLLCKKFAPRIAPALQELVGERATEVLPTLQSFFLEELYPSGPVQENIDQFVAARQLVSHPITVSSCVLKM
jgi:hypothetical protein